MKLLNGFLQISCLDFRFFGHGRFYPFRLLAYCFWLFALSPHAVLHIRASGMGGPTMSLGFWDIRESRRWRAVGPWAALDWAERTLPICDTASPEYHIAERPPRSDTSNTQHPVKSPQ